MKARNTLIIIISIIFASLIIRLVALENYFGIEDDSSDIDTVKSLQSDKEWQLIFTNNKSGHKIKGSKKDLINAVRKGYPIRVAWKSKRRNDSTKSVEHFIDADFLTIANGQDVFAQIKPFIAQRPNLTSDTLSMDLRPNQLYWILGTNGTINSMNVPLDNDDIKQRSTSTFQYDISWFSHVGGMDEH